MGLGFRVRVGDRARARDSTFFSILVSGASR